MIVIFKYLLIDESTRGLSSWLLCHSEVINAPKEGYEKYLLSALGTDFPAYSPHHAENVLNEIKRLERGEIAAYTWEGDGFVHIMTPTTVTFEHSIFGECPEWPLWSCTLAQYKAALQGWRKFIDMPQSIETELIVELPESNP